MTHPHSANSQLLGLELSGHKHKMLQLTKLRMLLKESNQLSSLLKVRNRLAKSNQLKNNQQKSNQLRSNQLKSKLLRENNKKFQLTNSNQLNQRIQRVKLQEKLVLMGLLKDKIKILKPLITIASVLKDL